MSVITFLLKRIQRQLNGKKPKKAYGENNIQKAWDVLENQQSNRNNNKKKSIGKKKKKRLILNPIKFALIIERKIKPVLTHLSNT